MKKIIVCLIAVLITIAMVGFEASDKKNVSAANDKNQRVVQSGVSGTVKLTDFASSELYIGEESAKAIVMKHANLTELEITYTKVKLDYDDGYIVYDIEFYAGDVKYDYEVDVYTGEILSYDYDAKKPVNTDKNNGSSAPVQSGNNSKSDIGEAAAKSAALAHAKLTEAQVTYTKKVKLERDDGYLVYDIEFYVENVEYDYEVDAYTGKILSYDREVKNIAKPDKNNGISGTVNNPTNTNPGTGNSGGTVKSTIGEAAAKSAALGHAKLTEAQVKYTKVKLDKDDGYLVYDIEFYAENVEYDYEVDAYTGNILSYDREIKNIAKPDKNNGTSGTVNNPTNTNPGTANSTIGEAAAKSAALGHAKLTEADVSYIKVKLDRDDGRTVYEIEFYAKNAEYDYEVDASTGKILSYDIEGAVESVAATNSGEYISSNEAKAIALGKAGLTADKVAYIEISFDYDHGIAVYDIEFTAGRMEYEIEINAVNGTVIEYDAEYDD